MDNRAFKPHFFQFPLLYGLRGRAMGFENLKQPFNQQLGFNGSKGHMSGFTQTLMQVGLIARDS